MKYVLRRVVPPASICSKSPNWSKPIADSGGTDTFGTNTTFVEARVFSS
jgi:hypothetical protein